MKRRSFLQASLMAAAASEAFGYPGAESWVDGESKPDLRRVLHFEHSHSGQVLIKSDAPPTPRHLVKPEVIDGIWGYGAYAVMRQPLHWHMIDNGWFDEDDLWFPFDDMSDEHWEWLAYYQPACEAHDIICGLFGLVTSISDDRSSAPDIGLYCGLHPSTPRYVTAKLYSSSWIPMFKEAVEQRSKFITVDASKIEPSPYL